MPAQWPGNSVSKAARAASGGGFESAIEAAELTGAPSISSVTDNGDGTLTISGSNFGTKAQAAPVLVDYVAEAYVNGVQDTTGGSWTLGDTMPVGSSGDTEAIWRSATATMKIVDNRPMRHAGLSRIYSGEDTAWLGTPIAYSEQEGTMPSGKQPFYGAWWFRQAYPAIKLWGIIPAAQPATAFIKDEVITCNGFTGVYAGNAAESGGTMHYLHFDLYRLVGNYEGGTVTGQTSGATMVFPDAGWGGSGVGFFSAGTKYARLWDDPSGTQNGQIRASIAVHDHYLRFLGGERVVENQGGNANLDVDRGEWALMEVELDAQVGKFRVYLNGALKSDESTYDPEGIGIESLSPVLTLIGNDGGPSKTQVTDVGEIYLDQGLSRVYLGNASTWDACSHRELQRPTAWAGDEIKVDLNEGELAGESRWVYVAGPDGSINATGGAV